MMRNTYIVLWIFLVASLTYGQKKQNSDGKTLFGDLTARHIGPGLMSGRINDLELHPTNNKIIYLGAAGGGVWKSNDGGATFNPIFDDHIQSIGTVKLDPNDPDNTIYVGTGEGFGNIDGIDGSGIWKSTDRGRNWELLNTTTTNEFRNVTRL